MLRTIFRQAISTASKHAGTEAKIGMISYPYGVGSALKRVILNVLGEQVPPEIADYCVNTSRYVAILTYPEDHCFQDWTDAVGEDDHVIGIEVSHGRTAVTLAWITPYGPIVDQTRIVRGNGRGVSRALSELASTVHQNICSIVISGDMSESYAHKLKLAIRSAVPSLGNRFRDPTIDHGKVASVGAACRAPHMEHMLSEYSGTYRAGHHDEL